MNTAGERPSDVLVQAEVLLETRQLDAAWAAYNRAESACENPDACSAGRWMIAMLRGDFETAWRESDAICARGANDPHRFWNGEDLAGKRVMLRCLHGYGDTVQLMRYAPLIRERAAKLIVEVAPTMVDLTKMFEGVDEAITWGSDPLKEDTEWDVQIEINELPYVFRTQAKDLPIGMNYLNLPKLVSAAMQAEPRAPGSLRVGLVWASGQWNPSRSVPAPLLERLLTTPGVEFWNLQGGSSRVEWKRFGKRSHLHEAEECADSVVGLAALIEQLDLVITPDTLAAHLAGALGTPAWVMLEYAADWRWQHGRNDSAWYPSLRLFRQAKVRDWESVLASVASELDSLVAKRREKRLAA